MIQRLQQSQIIQKFPKKKVREFFDDILETLRYLHQKYNIKMEFKIALAIGIFVAFYLAIHLSNLLFGTNSVSVYWDLYNRKKYLTEEIKKYHAKNALLQKEYFELKNLEPEE